MESQSELPEEEFEIADGPFNLSAKVPFGKRRITKNRTIQQLTELASSGDDNALNEAVKASLEFPVLLSVVAYFIRQGTPVGKKVAGCYPVLIQNLAQGKPFTLTDTKYGMKFKVAKAEDVDGDRGAYGSHKDDDGSGRFHWTLTPSQDSFFLMKDQQYGSTLKIAKALEDANNSHRVYGAGKNEGTIRFQWRLAPSDNSGNFFYLENRGYDTQKGPFAYRLYLGDEDKDKDRRAWAARGSGSIFRVAML